MAAGGRLGIAVSGGPDSLALLLLGQAALPGRVAAASVDHGLRPESASEAAMVARVCAARGIPHAVFTVQVASGNMQAEARAARYAALAEWAGQERLSAVATAHHADDQAETLLMRLNRGSGLSGLAGVRARRALSDSCLLIRPLLGWRKAELEAVCVSAGVEPVRDPSNTDLHYDRVRVRGALDNANWLDPLALARSAGLLAEADAAMKVWVEEVWRRAVRVEDGRVTLVPEGPRLVRLMLLAKVLALFGGEGRGETLVRLLETLEAGGRMNVCGVEAVVSGERWLFCPETPRR